MDLRPRRNRKKRPRQAIRAAGGKQRAEEGAALGPGLKFPRLRMGFLSIIAKTRSAPLRGLRRQAAPLQPRPLPAPFARPNSGRLAMVATETILSRINAQTGGVVAIATTATGKRQAATPAAEVRFGSGDQVGTQTAASRVHCWTRGSQGTAAGTQFRPANATRTSRKESTVAEPEKKKNRRA